MPTALTRLIASLVLASITSVADAEDLSAQDRAAIHDVIAGQLEAFQHDDGAGAYGFASQGIRRIFPSEDVFMDMVRRGYQPVYRPRSVVFGTARETQDGPVQEVFVVGPEGDDWTAVYTLERREGGGWSISGCRLVKAAPGSA